MKTLLLTLFALLPVCLFAQPISTSTKLEKTIIYLLDYVGKSDAVMIRNGSLSATKSMVSGKPYLFRLKDGKEIPCADWLNKVLKEYRQQAIK